MLLITPPLGTGRPLSGRPLSGPPLNPGRPLGLSGPGGALRAKYAGFLSVVSGFCRVAVTWTRGDRDLGRSIALKCYLLGLRGL